MMLVADNVTKRFGGLKAVDRVSFGIREGEILGLIGPNGAGKTTLFSVIAGLYGADDGKVLYRERTSPGCHPLRHVPRALPGRFRLCVRSRT